MTSAPTLGSAPPWRRALVTGGAGFLGSHLVTRLLDSGVEVDCLDDLSTGRPENVAPVADHPGFRFLELDVADSGCLDILSGPYDLVLHLAGPASPADCRRRPLQTLDAGSLGTRHALAVAERDGARFLFASACEACELAGGSGGPCTGDGHAYADPVDPCGAYAETKRFSEALVAAHAGARGSNAGIVRVFDTYGPRMRADDDRPLSRLLAQAERGEPVTVAGDGSRTVSLCYVDDAVDGMLRVAAGRSVRPLDIGGEEQVPLGELARRVIELTGCGAPLEFADGTAGAPGPRRPDTGFARELFGWRPRVSWQEGLERTVAAARPAPAPVTVAAGGSGWLS
ncbi:NAD-dependent epimerase/dehydratase family protein [Streptomyces sp. NPDC049915]|uniref:NAD-dependent epimerase/dehydratase family protein n=1 Tax=Streptomyces sp. NPDC049915 TaxID=3155510 RepID=UPI00344AEFFC